MQPGGTLLGEGEETTFVACQLHKLLPTLLAHQLRHAYALLAFSLLEDTAGCCASMYSVAAMHNMLCFAGCSNLAVGQQQGNIMMQHSVVGQLHCAYVHRTKQPQSC